MFSKHVASLLQNHCSSFTKRVLPPGPPSPEPLSASNCGCPIPGGIQGQTLGSLVWWLAALHIAGSLKPDDHCGPFQPRPFYDSMCLDNGLGWEATEVPQRPPGACFYTPKANKRYQLLEALFPWQPSDPLLRHRSCASVGYEPRLLFTQTVYITSHPTLPTNSPCTQCGNISIHIQGTANTTYHRLVGMMV